MTKRIAPSQAKAQELTALLQGHTQVSNGEELLSTLGSERPSAHYKKHENVSRPKSMGA